MASFLLIFLQIFRDLKMALILCLMQNGERGKDSPQAHLKYYRWLDADMGHKCGMIHWTEDEIQVVQERNKLRVGRQDQNECYTKPKRFIFGTEKVSL